MAKPFAPTLSTTSQSSAVSQSSTTSQSSAVSQSSATSYQAPYYNYGEDAVPGIYMVMFKKGHTIAKHLAFLGREFDLTALHRGYFANMDDQLLNAVRCDPGVEFVEDDVHGEDE